MKAETIQTPHLTWDEFLTQFKWKQGEHVTLVGPTGGGKTTLATVLLPMRSWVVVLATKRKDPLVDKLIRQGYKRVKAASDIHKDVSSHYVLQPPFSDVRSIPEQRQQFQEAIHMAFKQGGWTLYVDEGRYVSDTLNLSLDLESMILQQGRSLKVSLLMGVQRPVRIPVAAYDQATHLFFWRENDDRNLRTIGGLGGVDSKALRQAVAMLDWKHHQILYLNTRTGNMVTTKVEL